MIPMILRKFQECLSEKVCLPAWVDGAVFKQSTVYRLKMLANSSAPTQLESLPNIQQQGDEVLWPVLQNARRSRDQLPFILEARASVGDQAVPPQCPNNKQH